VLAVWAEGEIGTGTRAARVVVRLGGAAADVDAARVRIRDLAVRHTATIELDAERGMPEVGACFAAGRDFPALAAGELVVRLASLPTRLPAVAGAAMAVLSGSGTWLVDPRRGVLTFALTTDAAPMILAALSRVAEVQRAHLVVERFPRALASTIAVWHPLPPALPLMRRMKAALDPAGTLAPGRFVGRL
jgi:FAD/FMN-containing dehydrogenase